MRFKSCSTRWHIAVLFVTVFSLANIPLAHADPDRKGFSKEADRDEDRHERLRKSARKLIEAQERGEDITNYVDDLDKNLGEIEQEDMVNKKRFEEIEKRLLSLDGLSTVLARHREAREDYEKKSAERKGHIEALKKARQQKEPPHAIRQKVQGLLDFLEKHKIKREHDLKSTDTRLPWRMAQPGELLILGDVSGAPQQEVSPVSSTPATADDLAATADVQITPDIRALAASLNHSPLEIFRHVYNNYNYTPYYGSMKGSLDTYLEKEGNDFDLSSLLIALFRASNIPARYVRSQILVPIEKIQNQLGIDDPMAAARYLASTRIPASYYVSGGRLSHVQLQHVYVEAFVPYTNYRGSGEDDKGKVWLPFDPGFKQLTVTQQGVDIASAMNHDWKSFTSDYFADLRNVTPLEFYRFRVEDYIGQNYPEQTLDTLKRKSEIRTMKFDFLPNTLPYKTVAILDRFAAIPSELRHTIRFTIPGVLDHATTLPEISGRRITLTFTGATAEDQTVISAYGSIFKTPPYLIKVIPQLRIGGVKVAEGSPANAAGYFSFSIVYDQPGSGTETFGHHVLAGSYNAVGITTGKVRPEFLSIAQVEPSDEVYLAKMLHSLAMKYHDALSKTRETLNDTMRMQSKTFFTEALVSTHESVAKVLGDIPVSFEQDGFMIDAKELAMAALPIDGQNAEKKQLDFAMTFGYEGSYQENRVFEDNMFWVEGTSAVKGMQVLNALGIGLDKPEPYSTYENANLPAGVVADINNALNMGWRVLAPHETGGMQAVPYIKYDEKTGSAGFMLATAAGGLANEIMDMTWLKDFWLQQNVSFDFDIYTPSNPMLVAMGDAFEIIVKCIARTAGNIVTVSEADAAEIVSTNKDYYIQNYKPIPMHALVFGNYVTKYDGREKYKLTVAGLELTDADGKIIRQDGFTYISDSPKMPQLQASIKPDGLSKDVNAQIKIEYTRDNRSDIDTFPSTGRKTLPSGTSWDLGAEFGSKIRGGKATISWQFVGESSPKEFVFNIRASNPTEYDAKAYVGTTPWFIQGIVKQESGIQNGRTYLQFNELGALGPNWSDSKYCPNWGYPHGWGMMQVENPTSAAILWNWKSNVDKGKEVLQQKYTDSHAFWNDQVEQFELWKDTHPNAPPPPNSTFNGITFSYEHTGNQKSYEDTVWIKQYNGAYGGNYLVWKNNGAYSSNPEWQFHRLNNSGYDYVEKVCNKLP